MSKELSPLKALEKIVNDHFIDNEDKELAIIEKSLKTLDVIKKIVKYDIEVNGNTDILKYEQNEVITKEEYELLKKVLL